MSTYETNHDQRPESPCHPGSVVLPATANLTAGSHPEEHGKAWICSVCLQPFDTLEEA